MITVEKVRGICWRVCFYLWTLPNHNSRSLECLGIRACYSASAQPPTPPFWKPNVLGELQESAHLEMTDKSLRVKLVIVSLLEHNLNQQISHFRSFDSTRRVNTDECFGSFTFKPDIALPYVRYLGFFYHCNLQFRWNFICLQVLSKNYKIPFICKWPSPGLNKQCWCWKNFLRLTFLPDTATKRQVVDYFYHHDLAKILFTSMC